MKIERETKTRGPISPTWRTGGFLLSATINHGQKETSVLLSRGFGFGTPSPAADVYPHLSAPIIGRSDAPLQGRFLYIQISGTKLIFCAVQNGISAMAMGLSVGWCTILLKVIAYCNHFERSVRYFSRHIWDKGTRKISQPTGHLTSMQLQRKTTKLLIDRGLVFYNLLYIHNSTPLWYQ